jgi:hypothetical protein
MDAVGELPLTLKGEKCLLVAMLESIGQTDGYISYFFRAQTRKETCMEQDPITGTTQGIAERFFEAIVSFFPTGLGIYALFRDEYHGANLQQIYNFPVYYI